MLQIISGKFYKSPDRFVTPAKGITYSNYHTVISLATDIAVLEPVEHFSAATAAYVINYANIIEKPKQVRGTAIVRGGDWVIVRQFELLCIFGLRAFFDGDRKIVEMNCRAKPLQATDTDVPAHLVERFFEPMIMAGPDDTTSFAAFVKKVIGLPRKQYVAVINALETFAHSLEIINYKLDLAYSMLVYSLESLCQGFDEFVPEWPDYEDEPREQLDEILAGIDAGIAEQIRSTLLKTSHVRLRKRLLAFTWKHVAPAFFLRDAEGRMRPVRKSELERCLTNAYVMRSGYVHQLSPILDQLRIPDIARCDVFAWDNEVYFTYRGLLRLVYHVVRSFIDKQPVVDTEDYNWRQGLPGVFMFQAAPELWVGDVQGFTADIAKPRLSGVLSLIERIFVGTEPVKVNLVPLLNACESLMAQAKRPDQAALLALYAIGCRFLPPENRPSGYETVMRRYANEYRQCSIEMMLTWWLTQDTAWPWSTNECASCLESYRRKRFRGGSTSVPILFDLLLCAEVANRFLAEQSVAKFQKWCDDARFDAPGMKAVQEYLESCRTNEVGIDSEKLISAWKGEPASVTEGGAPTGEESPPGDEGKVVEGPTPEVGGEEALEAKHEGEARIAETKEAVAESGGEAKPSTGCEPKSAATDEDNREAGEGEGAENRPTPTQQKPSSDQ